MISKGLTSLRRSVLNADQDLRTIENHLPLELGQVLAGVTVRPWPSLPSEATISGLGTVLRLCNLRLRLHESFVSPAVPTRKLPATVDVRYHQEQILRCARIVINMWSSAVFARSWTQPLVVYVNTAITLSMLFANVGPAGLPEHNDVRAALAQMIESLRGEENGIASRAIPILDRLAEIRLAPSAGLPGTVGMQRSHSDVPMSQASLPPASAPALVRPASSRFCSHADRPFRVSPRPRLKIPLTFPCPQEGVTVRSRRCNRRSGRPTGLRPCRPRDELHSVAVPPRHYRRPRPTLRRHSSIPWPASITRRAIRHTRPLSPR